MIKQTMEDLERTHRILEDKETSDSVKIMRLITERGFGKEGARRALKLWKARHQTSKPI